jgi:hypothetical protein
MIGERRDADYGPRGQGARHGCDGPSLTLLRTLGVLSLSESHFMARRLAGAQAYLC